MYRLTNSFCLLAFVLALQAFAQTDALAQDERLKKLLILLGEKANKLQEDLYTVTWTNSLSGQKLDNKLQPDGKPQTSEADMMVLRHAPNGNASEAFPYAVSDLQWVNGKPRPRKFDQAKFKAPYVYLHHLWFLMPQRQAEYRFTWEGEVMLQEQAAIVLAMVPVNYRKPEMKVEKDCKFTFSEIKRKGKVWIDAQTFNVLQVQWELVEPFGAHVDWGFCRKGPLFVGHPSRDLMYEKSDTLIRFQSVAFQAPAQTLWLPASAEYFSFIREARDPGWRSKVTFTNYKRFVTDVQVKDPN